MKQSVTTEVEIPDGYAATGEFRLPQPYEYYLNCFGEAKTHTDPDYPAFILKKSWVWPKWLKAKYIAKDIDGCWFGYMLKPRYDKNYWLPSGLFVRLPSLFFDTEFPDVDAENSLMKNPHVE
jgi:hypothetical protein